MVTIRSLITVSSLVTIVLIIAFATSANAATVSDENAVGDSTFLIIFGNDLNYRSLDNIILPMTVYDTITQDETNWHNNYVSAGTQSLHVDLNWGNTANSLRLRVYMPSGSYFGPFYDADDGTVDGKISIYINNKNGLPAGTWSYEVYGHSVSGTQGYYI